MKSIRFHPAALTDLQEQAIYYEERSPGLGLRFIEQTEAALHLAASMPGIGTNYKYGTRRVFPKDFPHAAIYREEDDQIVVLAIAAFRRQPGFWISRT